MSDFVERCRSEWRRLGVPSDIVEDIASELTADVDEAGREGVSAQELLGSDPRAFARSWAAERGVVPSQRSRLGFPPRSRALVAAAALLSVAAIAAGVALLAFPASSRSALLPPRGSSAMITVTGANAGSSWRATNTYVAPNGTVMGDPLPSPSDGGRESVAWSLLIAGLVAIAVAVVYRWRRGAQVRRVTS